MLGKIFGRKRPQLNFQEFRKSYLGPVPELAQLFHLLKIWDYEPETQKLMDGNGKTIADDLSGIIYQSVSVKVNKRISAIHLSVLDGKGFAVSFVT